MEILDHINLGPNKIIHHDNGVRVIFQGEPEIKEYAKTIRVGKEEFYKLLEENSKLRSENHALKEQLKMFIPRRRVRRVYKMLGKILAQDGITDDLDD